MHACCMHICICLRVMYVCEYCCIIWREILCVYDYICVFVLICMCCLRLGVCVCIKNKLYIYIYILYIGSLLAPYFAHGPAQHALNHTKASNQHQSRPDASSRASYSATSNKLCHTYRNHCTVMSTQSGLQGLK